MPEPGHVLLALEPLKLLVSLGDPGLHVDRRRALAPVIHDCCKYITEWIENVANCDSGVNIVAFVYSNFVMCYVF